MFNALDKASTSYRAHNQAQCWLRYVDAHMQYLKSSDVHYQSRANAGIERIWCLLKQRQHTIVNLLCGMHWKG